MTLPQLRVRTEYSFRTCYGPVSEVADRLEELGTKTAGMVDTRGTWGHVPWEKELAGRGIQPAFGTEIIIPSEEGKKPRCWALAEDLKAFYRFSSSNPQTPGDLAAAKGVIRFAGAALTDPECFDYIDINPRSLRQTRRALELSKRTGKPLVITSDNDYPSPAAHMKFLAWDDSKKMTPQYLLSEDELRRALWYVDDATFAAALRNTQEVEERLQGVKLATAPIISVPGDLSALVEEGRKYRLEAGNIKEWTEEYQQRLEREVELIKQKQYESYFIVVADLVKWAKTKMLVGPARGSSAGSLVCYLLQITEVDPLVHDLLFERFIDVSRDDLPDIDIDFNDKKRYMVVEYLAEKYGKENVAHIGSINRLKPRSVVAHVAKKMSIPVGATFSVLNVLIEYSSGDRRYGKGLEDTINATQPGVQFKAQYPEAQIMGELENHASHTGVHAAGIIVATVPVIEYCTVRDGVAQIDKKDAEHLNLLKIDALGLRTLGVIEDADCVTPEHLYNLSLDDPEVLQVFDDAKFSGVFQFEGAAQRRVSIQVPMTSFKKIDHVTALARPGPLGGGATDKYIQRNLGREPVEFRHKSMEAYLNDTLGVVLYQEQVMRISFEIGCMSWAVVSELRKAMSGSKGKEYFELRGDEFAEGAATIGVPDEDARAIWDEICYFGGWGMNKSHTTSYAMISYWCAYMKRYHPLEYAAACLRSAKDDDQTVEILRELSKEGVDVTPFDPDLSEVNWVAKEGKLLGGYSNLIGIGPVKAQYYVQKREAEGLEEKDYDKLEKHHVKHQDLRPAHTNWGQIYDDPAAYNIHGQVKEFDDLKDRDNAVVVCRLVKKTRRDRNEAVLIQKRGGKREEGQTLFLDLAVVDDSISKPITARVNQRMWNSVGERLADEAVDGQDWFLLRGDWLANFSMMLVKKIKCLNRPELTS